MSQTLGKAGFLGKCGDAKGKVQGVVTLPQVTRGTSKQGPLELRCLPRRGVVEGLA